MRTINKSLMQNLFLRIKMAFSLRNILADEPEAGAQTVQGVEPQAGQLPNTQSPVGAQPAYQPPVVPMINYEQLIQQARQEEKNKLYPEINALKTQVADLTGKLNDAMVQIGTKEAQLQTMTRDLEALKSGQADPELVKTLNEKIASLTTELEGYKTEAQKAKLDTFKQAEIDKYQGQVVPEFITGNTEEEIIASVKASNEKYLEFAQRFGGTQTGAGAQAGASQSTAPSQTHGGVLQRMTNAVTPANPAIGVAGAGVGAQVVTPEMISRMSREQYAEYRKQAGIR